METEWFSETERTNDEWCTCNIPEQLVTMWVLTSWCKCPVTLIAVTSYTPPHCTESCGGFFLALGGGGGMALWTGQVSSELRCCLGLGQKIFVAPAIAMYISVIFSPFVFFVLVVGGLRWPDWSSEGPEGIRCSLQLSVTHRIALWSAVHPAVNPSIITSTLLIISMVGLSLIKIGSSTFSPLIISLTRGWLNVIINCEVIG